LDDERLASTSYRGVVGVTAVDRVDKECTRRWEGVRGRGVCAVARDSDCSSYLSRTACGWTRVRATVEERYGPRRAVAAS
jgi:hypothetical protein